MADQVLIPTIEIKEEPISFGLSGPTPADWTGVNLLPGQLKLEPTEWFQGVSISDANFNVATSPKDEMQHFVQTMIPTGHTVSNKITRNVRSQRQHLLHKLSPYEAETLTARKAPRTRNVAACMSKFQRIQPAPWPLNSAPPRSIAPASTVTNTEQRTVVSIMKSSSDVMPTHTPTVQSNQGFMIPIQSNNCPIVVPFITPLNGTTPGTALIPLQAPPNDVQNFQSIQQTNPNLVGQPPLGMLLTQTCLQDGSQSLAGLLPPNTINSVQASNKQTTCNMLGQLSMHNQLNPSLIHSVAPTSMCNVLNNATCISSCGQTIINSNALYSSPSGAGTVNVSGSGQCTANILNQPTIVTFPTFSNMLPVPSVSTIVSDPKRILNQAAVTDGCSNVSMYNNIAPAVSKIQSPVSSATNITLKSKPLLLPKPPQVPNGLPPKKGNHISGPSSQKIALQSQQKSQILVKTKPILHDKNNEDDDVQKQINSFVTNSPNKANEYANSTVESLSYGEICRKEQRTRLFRTTYRNYHLCKRLSLALLRASSAELRKVMHGYRLLLREKNQKLPFKPILTANKNMELVKNLLQIVKESTEMQVEKKLVVSRSSPVLTSLRRLTGHELTFLEERIYFVFKGNPFLRDLATSFEGSNSHQKDLEFMEVAIEPESIVTEDPGSEEWASIEPQVLPCDRSTRSRTVLELLVQARQDKQIVEKDESAGGSRECRTDEDQIEARNSSPLTEEASIPCPVCKTLCADVWTLYRHIGVCHLSTMPGIETCHTCDSQFIPSSEIHGCDLENNFQMPLVRRKLQTYRCYKCFKHLANNGQLLRHRLYCSALTITELKKRRKEL